MNQRLPICASISRLAISLLLLVGCCTHAGAQLKLGYERDSIPLFRGFAVSVDLAGLAERLIGTHGQYEAALRLNLHDQYFPIVEAGIGIADHENDAVTDISYKTRAPYFRIGADVNIMNKKHTGNRVFVGFRYGYTNYKVDIFHPALIDPVWKDVSEYRVTGVPCYQHWCEILFGLDAKVVGPLHVGWSGRVRFRVAHDDGIIGKTWYVPGYGSQNGSTMGYTFYVAFDI